MKLDEGYRKITAFAGKPDDGRHREEMLRLARELSGVSQSAALLWLYDDGKERLHLDHYEPLEEHGGAKELAGISLECKKDDAKTAMRVAAIANQESRARDRLLRHNIGNHRRYFRVAPSRGSAGYLEIATATRLSPDAETLLSQFAEVIASRILRHRDRRRLVVYEKLISSDKEDKSQDEISPDEWLQRAAGVALDATSAELCLVFQPTADLGLRVVESRPQHRFSQVAAKPESLIRNVFEKGSEVRILEHTDHNERVQLFGKPQYDQNLVNELEKALGEPLKTWIAAAVACDNEPVAVLFLANKSYEKYLPEVFSGTDFRLIQSISDVLSRGYAQAQRSAATRDISNFLFNELDGIPESRKKLLDVVRRHIHGVEGIYVTLRVASSPPHDILDFGTRNEEARGALDRWIRNRGAGYDEGTPEELLTMRYPHAGYYVYEERLHSVEPTIAVMHVLTRRQHVAKFERDMLKYLVSDLTQVVRTEVKIREEVENLIQIRHAIRSGLQGVRHLDNAWEVYQMIAKRGMKPTDFRVAMLRKSLQWARLFSERTRTLVEESRFLLGQIDREQLRLGGASISTLVKETIHCLNIDAEDRDLRFDFQNKVPASFDKVTMDRMLMQIAIFNLIDNAVKYSHRKTIVHVTLSTTNQKWTLTVRDKGVYINKDDFNAIFNPMVRRPTGQSKKTRPGTGLGLAVVNQVLEAHGGSKRVESTPLDERNPQAGANTTFEIVIPRTPPS